MTAGPGRGSYSLGEQRKGGGWWTWLLALLLLAAIVLALVLLLSGGDDDDSASRPTASTAASAASSSAPTDGTLTASGTSLLGVSGDLSGAVGDQAQGAAVTVQSVVEDEGFWVGTSETDRVYVEYGGYVGEDEATFRPGQGDRVNLSGPVRPAPEDPAQTLNLEADDADLVTTQGAYVNAESVEQAG